MTVTIDPQQSITMELSEACEKAADEAARRLLAELQNADMSNLGPSNETQLM